MLYDRKISHILLSVVTMPHDLNSLLSMCVLRKCKSSGVFIDILIYVQWLQNRRGMRKIFMLVMALLSGAVNATDFVYRVDSRLQEKFFVMGFRSHGSNRNLQQHIRGDSCAAGSRDSAFIATTTSLSETYNIARQYYSSSTFQGTLYRYRIRANNIFYPIQPSVNYLEGVALPSVGLNR